MTNVLIILLFSNFLQFCVKEFSEADFNGKLDILMVTANLKNQIFYYSLSFCFFIFSLNWHTLHARLKSHQKGIKLHKKKEQKDEKHIGKLFREETKDKMSFNFRL